MASEPRRSPGDLSVVLPEVAPTDVAAAVDAAVAAAGGWARTPLPERIARLRVAQEAGHVMCVRSSLS